MADKQATQRPNKPTTAHRLMEVFVGEWDVSGKNGEGAPNNPNAKVIGTESYEWLAGRFFLVYQWDRDFGDSQHIGTGMIGYDSASQMYTMHNFDNLGYERTYKGQLNNGKWTFTGENERATYTFSVDGRKMTVKWEISSDGSNWKPLCDLTDTKI